MFSDVFISGEFPLRSSKRRKGAKAEVEEELSDAARGRAFLVLLFDVGICMNLSIFSSKFE